MDPSLIDRRDSREKMICRILLLIQLISCVCGTFVVNVTQSSYQAEENDHITLEWTFPTKADTSINSINVYCELLAELEEPCVFHLHEGVEVPESQDKQFEGRVQWDKDVLRGGRLRLHVSRLRINDSGLYLCDVRTDDGSKAASCRLNVTAAADEPTTQSPTVLPPREGRGRIGLHAGLGLGLGLGLAAAALLAVYRCTCAPRSARGNNEDPDVVCKVELE